MPRFAIETRMKLAWLVLVAACGGAEAEWGDGRRIEPIPVPSGSIIEAMAGDHRSEENRDRDVYRHPLETLRFFGLEEHMTVVEIWPGAGWYTEILGPVLRDRGQLVAAVPSLESEQGQEYLRMVTEHPEVFGDVEVGLLNPPQIDLGVDGTADMVLTFRNVHNWITNGYELEVYRAAFAALRPGGIFGVVEHRANAGDDFRESARRGYVPEAHVIEAAQSVGFVLEDRSEINANPRDTKDYPEGVWTLPPTLRLGDRDRERYLEIGESDRMTLRFRKPYDAP
jgi:predicted methyltransferase